jgi:hypothetical protein
MKCLIPLPLNGIFTGEPEEIARQQPKIRTDRGYYQDSRRTRPFYCHGQAYTRQASTLHLLHNRNSDSKDAAGMKHETRIVIVFVLFLLAGRASTQGYPENI